MESLSEKIAEIVKPSTEITVLDTETSSKEVVKELKEMFYLSKEITDFLEFKNDGLPVEEGEATFVVDCKYLKYACGVMKYVSNGSKLNPNLIKITIFKTQLKLSGFGQFSFGVVFIPLAKQAILPTEQEISFIFDYPTLAKITTSFEKNQLTFNYFPEKKQLVMTSGNLKLELIVKEDNDFIHFQNKIKEINPVDCQLNIEVLQSALNYLSMFAKKDNLKENISLLEFRDSSVVGGSYTTIGSIQTEALEKIPLKIKYDVLTPVLKILPFFYQEKVKLFETENYYIIRDQNVYLGIEKTDVTFPPLKHLLTTKIEESFIVSRSVILSALQKLSVVTEDRDILISFLIKGKNPTATLTLSIKDKTGRKSKDILNISRQDTTEIYGEREYLVNLEAIFKTFSFFKTPEISIQELKDKAILVKDVNPLYSCTTIFSIAKETEV